MESLIFYLRSVMEQSIEGLVQTEVYNAVVCKRGYNKP